MGLKLNKFNVSTTALFAVCLSIFAAKAKYATENLDKDVEHYYIYYIHVATMIFVGFGFLMTFLSKYSFGAVGYNFFLSAISIIWGSLCVGFSFNVAAGKPFADFTVDLPFLFNSLFAAGAVMISFGAVLGKASPTQLLYMTIIELPIFAVAGYFIDYFKAADLGGSMAIHAFGAYFGLTVSLFISPPGSGGDHTYNYSTPVSDITAMIGTLFLWILWPSFNAAAAAQGSAPSPSPAPAGAQFLSVTAPIGGDFVPEGQAYRAIINTILSLTASCIAAFIISSGDNGGKLKMAYIQNATLAGGVAIGSSANLVVGPGGALFIGFLAGVVSNLGFSFLQLWLENYGGLRDTCGVHNLHAMPGVLGGLASAVVAVVHKKANNDLGLFYHKNNPAVFQLVALFSTLFFAIVGGAFTGLLLKSKFFEPVHPSEMYDDAHFWLLEEPEETTGYHHLPDDHPSGFAPP